MPPFLPYGRQLIEDDDIAAVVAALRSDRLAHGPIVESFEQAFADVACSGDAVACSSGSAALWLALRGLDVGSDDRVVVPAITFLATATAALMLGAEVVFADVDADSGLMTPASLAKALEQAGPSAKAAIPVHLGGRFCDMPALAAVAEPASVSLVEDACHAPGGDDAEGLPAGACTHSAAATFSFHPVKTLAAGEGGMVSLNDPQTAERLRRLRNHGVTHDPGLMLDPAMSLDDDGRPNPWSYEQVELGFNWRMDEMSAALGLSQLSKLRRFKIRRRALARLYNEALAPLAPLVQPAASGAERFPGLHLYQVLIDFEAAGVDRATVMRRMAKSGVFTQVHYIPVHRQPVFRARYGDQHLPGAEAFYARTLTLPLFPAMADGDVQRVMAALREALEPSK